MHVRGLCPQLTSGVIKPDLIHSVQQPSAELFQKFDKVLLLRSDGQTVYFGDVGRNAVTILHYFENLGATYCTDMKNPYVSCSVVLSGRGTHACL